MPIRAAIIAVMTIYLVPGAGIYPAAAAKTEEKPPVAKDLVMTQAQLRYCFFQEVRMDAASKAANNIKKHEIDALNALGGDWNARCSSFRYAEPDMAAVKADVKAARKRLKAEGQALVEGWRKKRKTSTYHVTASALKMRSGPGTGHGVIAKLKQYQNVYMIGRAANGWLLVTTRDKKGYVEEKLVRAGAGKQARRAYCEPMAGKRPANGEIILGKANGKNIIKIDNGRAHDAYVKLKGKSGRTILAIIVRKKSKVKIKDVPDGSYLIMFSSGVDFSRGCGNFSEIKDIKGFEDRSVFKSRKDDKSTGWTTLTVTLHPVKGGNAVMHDVG